MPEETPFRLSAEQKEAVSVAAQRLYESLEHDDYLAELVGPGFDALSAEEGAALDTAVRNELAALCWSRPSGPAGRYAVRAAADACANVVEHCSDEALTTAKIDFGESEGPQYESKAPFARVLGDDDNTAEEVAAFEAALLSVAEHLERALY